MASRRPDFGDFQTPVALAQEVCRLLRRRGVRPASIVEPTCGRGAFLSAALAAFPEAKRAWGVEIWAEHVRAAREALRDAGETRAVVDHRDFFTTDWTTGLQDLPEPLLVIGNPPWVTNSALGRRGSENLPPKANREQRRGIDALTGASNFDISEWMLRRALEWIAGRRGTLAVLCKTAVARKALRFAWRSGLPVGGAECYRIDAEAHFGASVDAGLLVVGTEDHGEPHCGVWPSLAADGPSARFGWRGGRLVADIEAYAALAHLERTERRDATWRSGIKHDCTKVMELVTRGPGRFVNGLGEEVELEGDYLCPMYKSTDLLHDDREAPPRVMLVPQRTVGEATDPIAARAPRTWDYLRRHGARLDRRASRIYRKRPRFAIFGVGPYSFTPWKVAVSGFAHEPRFRLIGPQGGRPVVFDDTCYFLPCATRADAARLLDALHREPAQRFLRALIFPDSKRPLTAGILRRLDHRQLLDSPLASPDGAC